MKSIVSAIRRKADQGWRLLWTGLSFAVFGLGGVVLGLIVFPLLGLFVWNANQREQWARRIISRLFRLFVGFMALFVLRYRIHGEKHHQDLSGCLIVANHPSLIDTVFLLALFPGADCVVKRAYWHNPFTFLAVRFARYIPNDNPEQLMTSSIHRLRQGRCLVLFPEGTRTTPGAEPDFKRGAAVIALRASADVLPVRLSCWPVTLTKGQAWYDIPERRVEFEIQLLPVLNADTYQQGQDSERAASFKLTNELKSLLRPGLNYIETAEDHHESLEEVKN